MVVLRHAGVVGGCNEPDGGGLRRRASIRIDPVAAAIAIAGAPAQA
jgi:hypothetical protein